jgi:hypothetical protein
MSSGVETSRLIKRMKSLQGQLLYRCVVLVWSGNPEQLDEPAPTVHQISGTIDLHHNNVDNMFSERGTSRMTKRMKSLQGRYL